MPVNRAAENALGTMGTICWTIQLLPQIWKSWRTKSTEGLSPLLVFLWAVGCPFLGVYVIVQDLNIPLIVQPQILTFLCLISWAQCLYYGRKYSFTAIITTYVIILLLCAGFQVGMVYAVRPSFRSGNNRPIQFFGIWSSVLLAVALLPQYYEIYKHREVIGISILFMLIDLLGGAFSVLSLLFKPKFDVVAGVTYSLVILLDGIVIILAMILNPLANRRRKREAQEENMLTELSGNLVAPTHSIRGQDASPESISIVIRSDAQGSRDFAAEKP